MKKFILLVLLIICACGTSSSGDNNRSITQHSTKGNSVYVWTASDFFLNPHIAEELQKLKDAGFSRMLISFSVGEINKIKQQPSELHELLNQAKAKDITTELLLGEPTWILPEHNQELINIIKIFEPFSFHAIHLDIEQDQLPKAEENRQEYALAVINIFKKVKDSTFFPVGVSLHPMYLDPEGPTPWFAEKLNELDLYEVTLMHYVTESDTTFALIKRVHSHTNNLPLSIAISVETPDIVDGTFSKLDKSYYDSHIKALNENNVSTTVQSWTYYKLWQGL